MIMSLASMIAPEGVIQKLPNGGWARGVPMPYPGNLFERCADAIQIVMGRAYAVRWPKPGDLERALSE